MCKVKLRSAFVSFFTKLRRKTASAFCTSIYAPMFRKRLAVWSSFFPFCTDIHFCTNVKLKLYSSVLYVYTSYEWRPASGVFLHNFHLIHCLLNVVQSCNFHFKKLYIWCLLLSSVRVLRWDMSFLTSYMEGTLFSF